MKQWAKCNLSLLSHNVPAHILHSAWTQKKWCIGRVPRPKAACQMLPLYLRICPPLLLLFSKILIQHFIFLSVILFPVQSREQKEEDWDRLSSPLPEAFGSVDLMNGPSLWEREENGLEQYAIACIAGYITLLSPTLILCPSPIQVRGEEQWSHMNECPPPTCTSASLLDGSSLDITTWVHPELQFKAMVQSMYWLENSNELLACKVCYRSHTSRNRCVRWKAGHSMHAVAVLHKGYTPAQCIKLKSLILKITLKICSIRKMCAVYKLQGYQELRE